MTAPEHSHETADEAFHPDASYAVLAQQEEIDRLRTQAVALADRNIYLAACLRQMQAEANKKIAEQAIELSQLRAQAAENANQITEPVEEASPEPARNGQKATAGK